MEVQADERARLLLRSVALHHLAAVREPLAAIGLDEAAAGVAVRLQCDDVDAVDDIGLLDGRHGGHMSIPATASANRTTLRTTVRAVTGRRDSSPKQPHGSGSCARSRRATTTVKAASSAAAAAAVHRPPMPVTSRAPSTTSTVETNGWVRLASFAVPATRSTTPTATQGHTAQGSKRPNPPR